jgi:hypothetical protein
VGPNEMDSGAEGSRDIGGEDIVPSAGIEVGGEWLMGRGVVCAEVYNAPGRGRDGAELHVARAAHANDLAADAAFLGIELQSDKVGIEEVGIRSGGHVKRGASEAEGDVSEAKGNGVCGADGVFARSHEKEKTKGGHIADGVVANGGRGKGNSEGLCDEDGARPGWV